MGQDRPITNVQIGSLGRLGRGKVAREWRRVGNQLQPSNIRRKYCWLRHQLRLRYSWWMRRHTPYTAVFVITTPRCGSTLLLDYMNQLPGVQSHSEVLNWGLSVGPRRRWRAAQVLRHIRYSLHSLTAPLRACKLFLDELSHYQLAADTLAEAFPGSRFVILYRQLLAEQFISHQLARTTRQWWLLEGQERKQAKVLIEPDALRTYCDRTRRAYHDMLALPWLAEQAALLTYEELSADPIRCLSQHICPLLGVPAVVPTTKIRKQNTAPLSERVSNYAEVATLLASPLSQQQHILRRQRASRAA